MRRASAAVSLAALLTVSSIAAQQPANQMHPTVPSPTAASLGKFGDIPISYFRGLPQISIPLVTAKGRTLELPISLNYHASGIKAEEIGGWVGMGWALEAGGVITRTVRGIVDEQREGYFNTGHVLWEPDNWRLPSPLALVQNMFFDQEVDGEPDQFFFNFAGQSGEFGGGDTSSIETAPNVYVTIPYRKWRFETQLGNDPLSGALIISPWVITTEDGTRYTFGASERHIDRHHEWRGTGGSYPKPYVSSWYLTEIRAPGGDVISLAYADYNAEHHTGMYREEVKEEYEANFGDCATPGYQEGSSVFYDLHSQSYIYGKRLATITSAAHTIEFSHSLREDARSPELDDAGAWGPKITGRVQQEPRLDLITVKTPEGVVLRKFAFDYTYQGPLNGRLTLLNVYEEDAAGNRLPPYSFTYDGPTLPARFTDRTDYHPAAPGQPPLGSFALDHWGYYNGATTNASPVPPGTSAVTGIPTQAPIASRISRP
jgi:hypothetical protein